MKFRKSNYAWWNLFVNQLKRKAKDAGISVVMVDPKYTSELEIQSRQGGRRCAAK